MQIRIMTMYILRIKFPYFNWKMAIISFISTKQAFSGC